MTTHEGMEDLSVAKLFEIIRYDHNAEPWDYAVDEAEGRLVTALAQIANMQAAATRRGCGWFMLGGEPVCRTCGSEMTRLKDHDGYACVRHPGVTAARREVHEGRR